MSRPEFKSYTLNEVGKEKAQKIATAYSVLLNTLESLVPPVSREFSIAKTKLEESAFFAKKAMAQNSENHQ